MSGNNNLNKRFKEENGEERKRERQHQHRRWHDLCAWLDDTVKLFGGSFEATRHELSCGQCQHTVRVVIRDVAVPSPVYDMMLGNIRDAGLTAARVTSVAGGSSSAHRCSVVGIEAANT